MTIRPETRSEHPRPARPAGAPPPTGTPIRPGIAAVLAVLLCPGPALAGPLDIPGCAAAQAALHGADPGRLRADHLSLSLPGQPGSVLHAARLDASAGAATLPPGALDRFAAAASAALLLAPSGHRDAGCSDGALRDAAAPLAQAIGAGGHAALAWTGLSLRWGDRHGGAARLSLTLDGGEGGTARLHLSVSGAVSNDPAAALLPEAVELAASLPADQVSALLGGGGTATQVSVDHLEARRGSTTLDGSGRASIGADPAANSGDGHVSVLDYDALPEAAGAAGLEKLRTGLFLAGLMAHRHGDRSDWDLAWQGGTLLVNNVPLPLR